MRLKCEIIGRRKRHLIALFNINAVILILHDRVPEIPEKIEIDESLYEEEQRDGVSICF